MRFITTLTLLAIAIGPIVLAETVDLEGVVKAVDADARTVTIERKTASGLKSNTIDVAVSAGDLGEIKPGTRITYSYDTSLEVITAMSEGDSSTSPFAAGTTWTASDSGMSLRVMHVQDDRFIGLLFNDNNLLRELHGEVNGNKVSWLAKDVISLKAGSPGMDNFGTIKRDKDGVRIDFEHGDGGRFTVRLAPKPQKNTAFAGRYRVTWSNGKGDTGEIKYEYRPDGVVLRGGTAMGRWKSTAKKILVTFDDPKRGTAEIVPGKEGFTGTHSLPDGSLSEWIGTRE
jgi:hypothetical protein